MNQQNTRKPALVIDKCEGVGKNNVEFGAYENAHFINVDEHDTPQTLEQKLAANKEHPNLVIAGGVELFNNTAMLHAIINSKVKCTVVVEDIDKVINQLPTSPNKIEIMPKAKYLRTYDHEHDWHGNATGTPQKKVRKKPYNTKNRKK